MIERYIKVVCDNCEAEKSFRNHRIFDVYTSIRNQNWAVSKDKNFVFCPKCKAKFSNTGRNGVEKTAPFYQKKVKFMERMARIDEEIRKSEEDMERRIDEELNKKYVIEDD